MGSSDCSRHLTRDTGALFCSGMRQSATGATSHVSPLAKCLTVVCPSRLCLWQTDNKQVSSKQASALAVAAQGKCVDDLEMIQTIAFLSGLGELRGPWAGVTECEGV